RFQGLGISCPQPLPPEGFPHAEIPIRETASWPIGYHLLQSAARERQHAAVVFNSAKAVRGGGGPHGVRFNLLGPLILILSDQTIVFVYFLVGAPGLEPGTR